MPEFAILWPSGDVTFMPWWSLLSLALMALGVWGLLNQMTARR